MTEFKKINFNDDIERITRIIINYIKEHGDKLSFDDLFL